MARSSEKAHLRFMDKGDTCTLTFPFVYETAEMSIHDNIVSVRQQHETVSALALHTKNKLHKLVIDKWKAECYKAFMDANDERNQPPVVDFNVHLLHKNKVLPDCIPLKELRIYKKLSLSVLNSTFSIVINSPLIEHITLPDVINCNHTVQPLKFKHVQCIHDLGEYRWYKSKDKTGEWIELGTGYTYNVQPDDANHYLKLSCIPQNEHSVGELFEVTSKNVVQFTPDIPHCPFEDRQENTKDYLKGTQFRLVCYNTLSSLYTSDNFPYCLPQYLSIDYRKQLLLKELFGYKADLICLQEIDTKIFSFYFRNAFRKLGYGTIFNKKGNRVPEGMAFFYKKERFGYAGQEHIVLSHEVKSNPALRSIRKMLDADGALETLFMKQYTSLQICKVKSKVSNHMLIVANTHLYYHPEASNIRLLQTAVCLKYLANVCTKESRNKEINVSVIFCGDFNSTPESEVFKYIVEAVVPYRGSDDLSTTLFHSFQLTSACGTPDFTNYTRDFKACLDYIFHDNKVGLVQFAPFPTEDILSANEALPSAVFPSDHVALVADFEFK